MKPFALIILTALILSACQANNTSPTPSITSTLSATETRLAPTATETPTLVPEMQEQKLGRISNEAIAREEKVNDPSTWTGEAKYYADINADPNIATDQDLQELHEFMTAMRLADFEKFLQENPDQANKIVESFVRGFLPSVSGEDIGEVVRQLTPEQRLYLEIVRRATSQEKIVLSQVEIIAMETNPNANVLYHAEYVDGTLTDAGAYGMWLQNSKNEGFNFDKVSYDVSMFGRTVKAHGDWIADTHVMDFVGVTDLPYGRTGILGLMKDTNGRVYLRNMIVVFSNEAPMTFDATVRYQVGGWAPDRFVGTPPTVSLKTNFAENRANYHEDFSQLTLDDLLQRLHWSPGVMSINTPSEHAVDNDGKNMVQSMFFDPKTGIPVIGSTDQTDKIGLVGIIFTTKDNFTNPWP